MPIEQVFEKKEDAPEWLHSHLVEDDGKFVFKGETAAEVENLKKTTKKERDARTKYEGELKKFERFKPIADADEDEWSQFLEAWNKRGEAGNGKPDSNPDAAKQLELKDKLHAKELKKATDELGLLKIDLTKAQGELREFRLWTPLREQFIKAGGIPEDWELARLDLASKNQFDFDEDGKIVVMEDGQASSVSPEKFFQQVYSDQRPKFYKASGAGGSGAPPGKGNGNSTKTIKREAWDKLPQSEKDAKVAAGFTVVD